MSTRASTLQNNTAVAQIRLIDSRYDVIKAVSEHLVGIEAINAIDIPALLAQLEALQNFTGITVVVGDVASFDPVTKVLTVPTVKGDTGEQGIQGEQGPIGPRGLTGPRGVTGPAGTNGTNGKDGSNGVAGLNGMVPIIEFSVDAEGNLSYTVVGYEEGPGMDNRYSTQEW